MPRPDQDDGPIRQEELAKSVDSGDADGLESVVDRLSEADPDTRKRIVRSLKTVADDEPSALGPVVPDFEQLLRDDERSVRLTTAKLFVRIAEDDPAAVESIVPALADRLADEDEFYFVRARAAEALGYVALEYPDTVASPEVLADLRVGLSFDEPEVKTKLAKAIEFVALGNPRRLRHQVPNLTEHLDDEAELVRYHLCTALVVVGCEFPSALADEVDALVARVDDESRYVQGRAAEALGLLERSVIDDVSVPESNLEELREEEEPFVSDRAEFAIGRVHGADEVDECRGEIGTVQGVHDTTPEAVDAITSPDGDGECAHCGLALPENGPPMCPRCGAPH